MLITADNQCDDVFLLPKQKMTKDK